MQAEYPEIIKELIIKAKSDITAATSLSLIKRIPRCSASGFNENSF